MSFGQTIVPPEPPVNVPTDTLRRGLWLAGYDVTEDGVVYGDDLRKALQLFATHERVSLSLGVVNTHTVAVSPPSLVDKVEALLQEGTAGKDLYDLAAAVELAHRVAADFKERVPEGLFAGTLTPSDRNLYLSWIAAVDEAQAQLRELVDEDRDAFLSAAQSIRVDPQQMRALLDVPVARVGSEELFASKEIIVTEEVDQQKALPVWVIVLGVVAALGAAALTWDAVRSVITTTLKTIQLQRILGAAEQGLIDREDLPGLIEGTTTPEGPEEGSLFDRFWGIAKPWVEVALVVGAGVGIIWLVSKSRSSGRVSTAKEKA